MTHQDCVAAFIGGEGVAPGCTAVSAVFDQGAWFNPTNDQGAVISNQVCGICSTVISQGDAGCVRGSGVQNVVGCCYLLVCIKQLVLGCTVQARVGCFKADSCFQLLSSLSEHHKTVAATCCAASAAAGTRACCGGFKVGGGVEAGCQGLFQIRIGLGFFSVGWRLAGGCLPAAVLRYIDHVAVGQLQGYFCAQTSEDLFAHEQTFAFEYLALEAVERNGKNLTDKTFYDGDDCAHKAGSGVGSVKR